MFACPCCGFLTLSQKAGGSFEICPVCYWEDDNVQLEDPDFSGGANTFSLNQSKKNFAAYGAIERRFLDVVRGPAPEEIPLK